MNTKQTLVHTVVSTEISLLKSNHYCNNSMPIDINAAFTILNTFNKYLDQNTTPFDKLNPEPELDLPIFRNNQNHMKEYTQRINKTTEISFLYLTHKIHR